jgi:hypothetical protein
VQPILAWLSVISIHHRAATVREWFLSAAIFQRAATVREWYLSASWRARL